MWNSNQLGVAMEKLKDLQKEEYDIMKRIHKFCGEHDIKYMLYAGTLLGAVRHKGFIPWDDDMDIAMSRESFEKFDKLLVGGHFDDEEYHYQSNKTYKYYASEATKVRTSKIKLKEKVSKTQQGFHGAWVDIFPYDNIPDDPYLREQQFNIVHKYDRILYFSLLIRETDRDRGIKKVFKKSMRLVNELLYPLYFFVPIILNKRHEAITQYNSTKTMDKGNFGYMFYKDYEEFSRNVISNDDFKDLIKLDFRESQFLAPKNYGAILTKLYGDYMQIPDEADREVHDMIAN